MKMKKIIKLVILLLCICIVSGVGIFLYNAYHGYNINGGFVSIPLNYNADNSSSFYSWNGTDITVYGGFVKGIQNGDEGESLVVRALSPLPEVVIKSSNSVASNIVIALENINPEAYASRIDKSLNPARITVNTLEFKLNMGVGETIKLNPSQPADTEDDNYVILGDSRDGYENFDKIITQLDALNPAFVIDNGDLVFSGKPNQYRLFDQTISEISTTLCTTLGNHDIKGTGRDTYTKLYGPEYYSFNYGNNHFVFLDSSRGYSEKQAISDEQYAWLERDLQKAQGKRIYVISHIPSTDPRSGILPNEIEAYTDQVKRDGGFIEQKLEAYSENESIDHGFRDKQETARFEILMAKYKVSAVYLSHIHSYFDYKKDGVRYVISGGAGAELLTQNSYYHYLIAKAGYSDTLTMVQLPSPSNLLIQRYSSTVSLFAQAMYRENSTAVVLFITGLVLLALLLLILLFAKNEKPLALFWTLVRDTGKYISQKYEDLFKNDD